MVYFNWWIGWVISNHNFKGENIAYGKVLYNLLLPILLLYLPAQVILWGDDKYSSIFIISLSSFFMHVKRQYSKFTWR